MTVHRISRAPLGVSFDYKAGSQGLLFNFDAYGGNPESRSTYHFTVESVPESLNDWVHYELHWDKLLGVDWEENPGTPINPNEINGFAFGFSTYTDSPNSGTIWIDNFSLITPENQAVNQKEIKVRLNRLQMK